MFYRVGITVKAQAFTCVSLLHTSRNLALVGVEEKMTTIKPSYDGSQSFKDGFESIFNNNKIIIMKTIIAPVDFSANSKNAAKYAADLALSISADLTLFHVLQFPLFAGQASAKEQAFEEMHDVAFDRLNILKANLNKHTLGKINISLDIESGRVMPQIKEYCAKKGPFIVVMGMDNKSSKLFGSNSLDAVDHLPYPLIIVPEDASFRPIHKIGLALDKAFVSNLPLEYLKKLQNIFSAQIDVLYVNPDNKKEPDSSRFKLLKEELTGLPHEFHFITANKLEEGMNKLLEDTKVDLLLLIPKFHPFFEFHESQSKILLLHCPGPVMTIHE